MDAPLTLGPGVPLGPYTLLARIGAGAYATVWEAEDALGRRFALKIQPVGRRLHDRRFHREFDQLRALRIPGVVRVHDTGQTRGAAWFVMDLVRGETFVEAAAAPSIADRVQATIRLGRQLAEALAGIHAAGLAHRDIKPSNVLVDGDGKVVVLDFGLARANDAVEGDTGSGQVAGTVPYMAPEQIAALPTDPAVDLFALGLILHEAIAGPRPRSATPIGWISRTCLERLPPLALSSAEVPLGLSLLVAALTDVEPSRRPRAAEVGARLAGLALEDEATDLPDPPWIDREADLHALEGAIGAEGPAVVVLSAPAGGGKRRLVEMLQRNGMMGGVWTVHGRCRVATLGGALAEILAALVGRDEDALSTVTPDDRQALSAMWPEVVPPTRATPIPSLSDAASAFVTLVQSVAQRRPLLLVVHGIDQIDTLTGRALASLATERGPGLGCVMTTDPRWASSRSEKLIRVVTRAGGRLHNLQPLPAEVATRVARGLSADASVPTAAWPRAAAEAGWRALLATRGRPFHPPVAALWPLAVLDDVPVPEGVVRRLVGPAWADDPDLQRTEAGVLLRGSGTLDAVRTRLADRSAAAAELARAWEHEGRTPGARDAADAIATAWLLAGRPARAREVCLTAALEAVAGGRAGAARRWLALADTLPEAVGQAPAFDVAMARARVILRASAAPMPAALEAAEGIASTPDELQEVRILRAEHALRHERPAEALVGALRQASLAGSQGQPVPVHALVVACEARLALGQWDEAEATLLRAQSLGPPPPRLAVLEAQIAFARGRASDARRLGLAAVSAASVVGHVEEVAAAAMLVSRAQRQLGQRAPAEHQARAAVEGFAEAGDPRRSAEAVLDLALLLVERGDAARARPLVERLLRSDLPSRERARLVRAALLLAMATGDDAAAPLQAELLLRASLDDEAPAALVRFHRVVESRLGVEVDPPSSRGYGLAWWRLERARGALELGQTDVADHEATLAIELAKPAGYREIALTAELLLGFRRAPAEAWAALLREASQSLALEVYLFALELDARRAPAAEATGRWRALRLRAEELGHRPTLEVAGRAI